MGTYLLIGIIQEITIYKIDAKKFSVKELESALNKEISIHQYVYAEKPDRYQWTISSDILVANNLVGFLQRQYELIYNEPDEDRNQALKKLQELKNSNEIIAYAKEKENQYFQYVYDVFDWIEIPNCTSFSSQDGYVKVEWMPLVFHMEGKMILECYKDTFRYIDNLIRLQRSEFPIADCVKVLITN